VDTDNWIFSRPLHLEQGMDIAEKLIDTGKISFMIVDSVAAMTPKDELEGNITDNSIGLQARKLGQTFRKMAGLISRKGVVAVFLNQIREKVGVYFGDPTVTPGGKALKFYSSIRIRITGSKSKIYNENERIMKGSVLKNSTSTKQGGEFVYLIRPDIGISYCDELFDLAMENGIITESGKNIFSICKHDVKGRDKFVDYICKSDKVKEYILQNLNDKQTERDKDNKLQVAEVSGS